MFAALAFAATAATSTTAPPDITVVRVKDKTVAVLPWVFRGGTPSAVQTARETIGRFFDDAGYDRMARSRVLDAWPHETDLNAPEGYPMPDLPSDSRLRKIGQNLGVDLVCAGEMSWHTRSIWVALGPKTKSTCTLSMKMIDLDNGNTVLADHAISADDTAEESGFETAAGIISGGLVTVVSGGPETPHQQRAAQIVLSEAFEPWLEGVFGRN